MLTSNKSSCCLSLLQQQLEMKMVKQQLLCQTLSSGLCIVPVTTVQVETVYRCFLLTVPGDVRVMLTEVNGYTWHIGINLTACLENKCVNLDLFSHHSQQIHVHCISIYVNVSAVTLILMLYEKPQFTPCGGHDTSDLLVDPCVPLAQKILQ